MNASSSAAPGRQLAGPPVAVVTGGARGLGLALAERFAAAGHRVVVADLEGEALRAAAARLGEDHLAVAADVTRPEDTARLAEAAVERYGRLDVWVNNAGVLADGPLAEQDPGLAAAMSRVNLDGTANGCRAALGVMLPAGRGRIVNVSSLTALKPLAGLAHYSATKAAVAALSAALHREVKGSGVRVTAVLPHLLDTPAGSGLRARPTAALPPERVADAVVRLVTRGGRRQSVCVPWWAGPALRPAAFLPGMLRDLLDDLMRLDEIALGRDTRRRARYTEELRARY
ncbi:SDR family NAD(P)-dependent oxidoreductase, partial [Streptomyces sp. CO7]